MRKAVFALIVLVFLAGRAHAEPPKAARVLVTLPNIEDKAYLAVAEVFAGRIIRDVNHNGGFEIVSRAEVTAWLREKNLPEWAVSDRTLAAEAGRALGADVVIYSSLGRNFSNFLYSMGLLEVKRDVVQRVMSGSFLDSSSPEEIGKLVSAEMKPLIRYIPLPEEIGDPGLTVREVTVNPDSLPQSVEIELPPMDTYGHIEQVLSSYRVFPSDTEYAKLASDQQISRIQVDDENINEDLKRTISRMQMYGEFALRYNMQAYLVKNCSVRALNVLLANKVPVFWTEDEQTINVLNGYRGLRSDGASIFRTNTNEEFDSFSLMHRQLIAVLIVLPKLGRAGGISRDFLQNAIGVYHNDWGKTPELAEIKEGILDIISSGMEADD